MKYVIIGGDAAGMSAAMQIINLDDDAEVITLERGNVYSYGQCGLPYTISGVIPSTDLLIARSVETFRERFGIDARIFHEVQSIDVKGKRVIGQNTQTGEEFKINYDKLLIATGADPILPDWQGVDLGRVHQLKTISDAEEIIQSLREDVQNVTVIGGGYIGLEAAESFRALGKNVRLIHRGASLAKIFDPEMAEYIKEEAQKHGIEVILNEQVSAIEGEEHVQFVRTDKNKYPTDLVLISTGIRPNTSFIEGTGITRGIRGAIQTDPYMETNVKDIFAAGDCTLQYHLVKEEDDYIPLGTTANKQGRIAGMNMAGQSRKFAGITGSSIIQFMDLSLGKTGLSDWEAEQLGIPYDTIKIEGRDIANYYPGAQPIHVKLTYRSDNNRLLGGQIIGSKGVDKRIDVLATALYNQMTLSELEDLDLSYAPPYNGSWDPIQRAARQAMRSSTKTKRQ